MMPREWEALGKRNPFNLRSGWFMPKPSTFYSRLTGTVTDFNISFQTSTGTCDFTFGYGRESWISARSNVSESPSEEKLALADRVTEIGNLTLNKKSPF